MTNRTPEVLSGVLTESQLCQRLNLTGDQVARLRREKSLPYVRLTSRDRLYLELDLMDFFKEYRTKQSKPKIT